MFPLSHLDYYEDPLKSPLDSPFFPYPLAFDETIRSGGIEKIPFLPQLKALIIKPSLMGGCSRLTKIVSLCQKKGIDFILSSSYESEIGLMQIAKLEQRLKLPKKAIGLDTSSYFLRPLIKGGLRLKKGNIILPGHWSLNQELIDGCF